MARRSQRIRRQKRIEIRKAIEQEMQLSKSIEDNSVIIERMKTMSNAMDEVLQTFDTSTVTETEQVVTPKPVVEMKAETPVEMKIQPYNEPSLITPEAPKLKRMTKRALISYAKDNDIATKSTMTKAQIIKAIQEA